MGTKIPMTLPMLELLDVDVSYKVNTNVTLNIPLDVEAGTPDALFGSIEYLITLLGKYTDTSFEDVVGELQQRFTEEDN